MAMGGGAFSLERDPEFPAEPGATWAIATFEAFHAFAIDPDFQRIYTEMNFRVDVVLKTPSGLSLSTGSVVDVGISGGRIKSPNGEISSFLMQPAPHYYQLGHKYLVQFLYHAQGDFFSSGARWDVSSGTVQPDDDREIARASIGKSTIVGMSLADLVRYLPSVLPEELKK
jgi:hypothetical protein